MKKLFYFAIGALVLFELANMNFIMPMPFSQRMRSIDVAYFLYTWRWLFRLVFGAAALAGLLSTWRADGWRKWLVPSSLLVAGLVVYAVKLALASDSASFFAFEQPDAKTRFALRSDSLVAPGVAYALSGRGDAGVLKPVSASQEFWHGWRTFHPGTRTY